MGNSTLLPSQVLIVPGYTNEEIISMSATTEDTTASALKNGTSSEDKTNKNKDKSSSSGKNKKKEPSASSSKAKNQPTNTAKQKDKKNKSTKNTKKTTANKKNTKASSKDKKTSKVNESSAATGTASTVKVEKPKALIFSPTSVDYTVHRKNYEEFNSADGLILIEKACDQFAELQLSLDVHQAMRIRENQIVELSEEDKRNVDIITSGAPTIWDKETDLGHFIDPSQFTDSYIDIRRGFFDNYKNRPLTLISDLFPPIPVCFIVDMDYSIDEGEETAKYNITFKEVDNVWY